MSRSISACTRAAASFGAARASRSASSSWFSVRSSPLSPSGRSGLRARSASVQIAVTGMISSCRRVAPAP